MRMTATFAVVTDTLSEALLVAPPGTSVHNLLPPKRGPSECEPTVAEDHPP